MKIIAIFVIITTDMFSMYQRPYKLGDDKVHFHFTYRIAISRNCLCVPCIDVHNIVQTPNNMFVRLYIL